MRFFEEHICIIGLVLLLSLFAEGEAKRPTLNWMGREKATKFVKNVVMKFLREDKSLGNVATANTHGLLGNGNIEIGNTSLPQWQHSTTFAFRQMLVL